MILTHEILLLLSVLLLSIPSDFHSFVERIKIYIEYSPIKEAEAVFKSDTSKGCVFYTLLAIIFISSVALSIPSLVYIPVLIPIFYAAVYYDEKAKIKHEGRVPLIVWKSFRVSGVLLLIPGYIAFNIIIGRWLLSDLLHPIVTLLIILIFLQIPLSSIIPRYRHNKGLLPEVVEETEEQEHDIPQGLGTFFGPSPEEFDAEFDQ